VGHQDRCGCGLPVAGRCMCSERGAAFSAELRALWIRDRARRAPQLELGATLGAEHRVHEILGIAFGAPHCGLRTKLVEQRLGLFQVGCVEAFGEPVVDFREHRARFVAFALPREEAREARRGAQLP